MKYTSLESTRALLDITLRHFPLYARIWVILLFGINGAAIFFLGTPYGQAALVAAGLGGVMQLLIHMREGYTRLVGAGHVFWVPLVIWFWMELPEVQSESLLWWWMIALTVVNTISLVIDTVEVVRYLRGEREVLFR